jgi:hypothetical protein
MGRFRRCVMFGGLVEYADDERNNNPNLIKSNLKRFIDTFHC